MTEMMKCRKCGREKKIDSFYRCSSCKNGRQTHCKICQAEWNKKYRQEHDRTPTGKELKMTNVGKKDFCQTYKFLIQLGYDPSGDVALQFSQKYGTKYKPRKKKDLNAYSFQDCLESNDWKNSLPNTDLLD